MIRTPANANPLSVGPMTAAEFAWWPDRKEHELLDGWPSLRPGSVRSAGVTGHVLVPLMNAARQSGEAEVFTGGLGCDYSAWRPNTVLRPTLFAVRADRLAKLVGDPEFLPFAPDLAVEITPPVGDAMAARVRDHMAAGVTIVWVVHPPNRTVTVHCTGHPPVLLSPGQSITADPVLTALRCDVGRFSEHPTP